MAVYWHRFAAFLASSVLTGMAGTVVAYQYVAVSPAGVANVNWSLNAVLMTLVGGMGSLLGPPLGVVIVYYGLTRQLEDFQVLSLLVEGVLLVAHREIRPGRRVGAAHPRGQGRAGGADRDACPNPRPQLTPSDVA